MGDFVEEDPVIRLVDSHRSSVKSMSLKISTASSAISAAVVVGKSAAEQIANGVKQIIEQTKFQISMSK